jgi:hypothetical protein
MRLLFLFLVLASAAAGAQERSKGETLYLPIYSHIWHGDVGRDGKPAKMLMSVSVSIRNTDPASPIRVTSAEYYDTDGKKLKEYIAGPNIIGPMGTEELFIARSDDRGGSGANFVIRWSADSAVSPPMVEAVHANLPGGRSIVFTTSARRIPPR